MRRLTLPDSPSLPKERDQSLLASAATDEDRSWPQEDCANGPSPLHCFGETRTLWVLGAKVTLALLLFITAAQAAVREVGAIGLTAGERECGLAE